MISKRILHSCLGSIRVAECTSFGVFGVHEIRRERETNDKAKMVKGVNFRISTHRVTVLTI